MKKFLKIVLCVMSVVLLFSVGSCSNKGEKLDNPWENGGKNPEEYTWEEFEALTGPQQIAFQNSFENEESFEKWMNEAVNKVDAPWEKNGKKPEEYTWEEFEALTGPQQIVFQNSFEDENGFEDWLAKVAPK